MESQAPKFLVLLPMLFMIFMFIIITIFSVITTLLLVVLPFWKICQKAGYHGAISLLMMVPVANIVLPFYLAFSEWPAHKNRKKESFDPKDSVNGVPPV